MSLSFLLVFSLLSSQGFLVKKLLPSSYEIAYAIKKSSSSKKDEKIIKMFLESNQKFLIPYPITHDLISKNVNYEQIFEDFKTNTKQLRNKQIKKRKKSSSSSSSLAKIYLTFEQWKNLPNYNKRYSIYYYAQKHLQNPDIKQFPGLIDNWRENRRDNNRASYYVELSKVTNDLLKEKYQNKLKINLKNIANGGKHSLYFKDLVKQLASQIIKNNKNKRVLLWHYIVSGFQIQKLKKTKPWVDKFKFSTIFANFITWLKTNNYGDNEQIDQLKETKFLDFNNWFQGKNQFKQYKGYFLQKFIYYLNLEVSDFKIKVENNKDLFSFKLISKTIDKNIGFEIINLPSFTYNDVYNLLASEIKENLIGVNYNTSTNEFTINTRYGLGKLISNYEELKISKKLDLDLVNNNLENRFKEKINQKEPEFQKMLYEWYLDEKKALLQNDYQNYKLNV